MNNGGKDSDYKRIKQIVERTGTTIESVTVMDFALYLKANSNIKCSELFKGSVEDTLKKLSLN